jgi:hypothetical protein
VRQQLGNWLVARYRSECDLKTSAPGILHGGNAIGVVGGKSDQIDRPICGQVGQIDANAHVYAFLLEFRVEVGIGQRLPWCIGYLVIVNDVASEFEDAKPDPGDWTQSNMAHKIARLALSRTQILAFRRRVGSLDERMPVGAQSLHRAAWAGLQDSVPRAALLSIHARVAGTRPTSWEHPSLVQLWGPRFSDYVVASEDLAIFSLGRLPVDARGRGRAHDTARRLHAFLEGRRMPFGQAGRGMGVAPNSLRYASATGTVLLRWDGARQPVVWTAPPPDMDPGQARLELARRYLHVFGPATAATFGRWAGMRGTEANSAFAALASALTPTSTAIGDGWILASDEELFRAQSGPAVRARLLPSGDAFYLLWGADREMLVPDAKRRAELWTTRVWPGALLVGGEIAGTWRRSAGEVSIDGWRRLSGEEREAVEAEAMSLPLGLIGPITVRWS